ncbi:unnamed protein product [Heterobilharzia americana]|nr:unnamed protein product [Heterobilharzia americana]
MMMMMIQCSNEVYVKYLLVYSILTGFSFTYGQLNNSSTDDNILVTTNKSIFELTTTPSSLNFTSSELTTITPSREISLNVTPIIDQSTTEHFDVNTDLVNTTSITITLENKTVENISSSVITLTTSQPFMEKVTESQRTDSNTELNKEIQTTEHQQETDQITMSQGSYTKVENTTISEIGSKKSENHTSNNKVLSPVALIEEHHRIEKVSHINYC